MFGVAASNRVILQRPKAMSERDMVGLGDVLITEEQHLMLEQCLLDRAEQVVAGSGFRQGNARNLGADMRREFLGPHHMTKIEEPVVCPASRSRCACTASSSA